MYGIFMPFNYISSSFFIHKWFNDVVNDTSVHRAGEAMALPFLISGITVPFIGLWIDSYGKRAKLMIFSSFLVTSAFVLFLVTDPIFGLILFGISYSLFASIVWPAITIVINSKLIGFALGLTTSFQNFSMSLFPIIVAYLYNKTNSYTQTLSFFIFLAFNALLLSFIINFEDKKYENVLNRNDPENVNVSVFERECNSEKLNFFENKFKI